MKNNIYKLSIGIFVFILAGTPTVALARGEMSEVEDRTEVRTSTASQSPSPETPKPKESSERQRRFEAELRSQLEQKKIERQSTDVQTKRQEAKVKSSEKLDDAKKKACENNITTINRLKEKMDERRQTVLERISKISDAIQSFYTEKQLTVTNYDELVAKVSAAKTVAESALQLQQQIPTIDCSGDHPRVAVSDFKEKRSSAIDAIKAYRDAVKELVRAVKAVVEVSEQEPSPTPSATNGTEGGN